MDEKNRFVGEFNTKNVDICLEKKKKEERMLIYLRKIYSYRPA